MGKSDKTTKQRESVGLWALNEIQIDNYYSKREEDDGRVSYIRSVFQPQLPEFFYEDDWKEAQKKRQHDERLAGSSGDMARVARGYQGRLISQEIASNPNLETVTSSGLEAQKKRGAGKEKKEENKKKEKKQ